jgi:hypothetical protein
MHAMAVQASDRFAILLGRETKFPAQAAYFIAHEIGHIVGGHTMGLAALVDVDDPFRVAGADYEEYSANRFALELLTGDPEPQVISTRQSFSATQLADAAMTAARNERVDPGVLALCLAHTTGRWTQGFGALKIIPPGEVDVGGTINALARHQLVWSSLGLDAQDYLTKVMGEAVAR